ncbi:hypothetical protein AFLA_011752 [Aspergillus flavus NRRL3357]|nr:hypothetical protein AFLA_011752 [Aspergillus flavus NRRL3357]
MACADSRQLSSILHPALGLYIAPVIAYVFELMGLWAVYSQFYFDHHHYPTCLRPRLAIKQLIEFYRTLGTY